MRFKLIHQSQIAKGDVFIRLDGRPTRAGHQHSPGLYNMAYVDLDEFPGWIDGEMVVVVEQEPCDAKAATSPARKSGRRR